MVGRASVGVCGSGSYNLTTLQLPVNALEPEGAAVAAEIANSNSALAKRVSVMAHRVLTSMLPPREDGSDPGGTFRLVHDPTLVCVR